MEIKGWKYYNHAAIPTSAPHEEVNTEAIESGDIWKLDGGPMLARWTSDFDCGHETNWWYIIRKAPFDLEGVAAKERKRVRQALKKCYVKQVDMTEVSAELYACYSAAFEHYENADNLKTKEQFEDWCRESAAKVECWAAYDNETDILIGFITACVYDTYVELQTAKFTPEYFNRQASDASYYVMLDHYLNSCNKQYVSSGSRNINHKTNTQEYKIRRFGYEKAYCTLHIEYKPKIKTLIKIIYPFRKILRWFDKITIVHQVNSLLVMEEVKRGKKKDID